MAPQSRKKGAAKQLRLCCHGPKLGFMWLLPQNHCPKNSLPCQDTSKLPRQEGWTARTGKRQFLGATAHHFTNIAMLPSMPEAPWTQKTATGTFLKALTAVLGVGQEQWELRSLRKTEGSLLVAPLHSQQEWHLFYLMCLSITLIVL